MPEHVLATLDRISDPGTFGGQIAFLRGEALCAMGLFREAIRPLEDAADLAPSNLHVWVALAWCYKRTGQLSFAIQALESGLDAHPDEALLHYNLACYWSLGGNKDRALQYLEQAIELDSRFRDMTADEPDFDPIRTDPRFQTITSVIV